MLRQHDAEDQPGRAVGVGLTIALGQARVIGAHLEFGDAIAYVVQPAEGVAAVDQQAWMYQAGPKSYDVFTSPGLVAVKTLWFWSLMFATAPPVFWLI
ncbi:hypothetical protein ABH935_001024 [Catenulispora sp. GAS73]